MRRLACQPCELAEKVRRPAMRPLRRTGRSLQGNDFLERSKRRTARSEAPALCVAHKEIAERLDARDRLELFRIDEERIELRAFFLAEQLHQADVLLHQIVR